MNAKRPEVPEGVLRYPELVALGKEAGLNVEVRLAPTLTNPGPTQTIYFLAMRNLPLLPHVLPSTVGLIIRKPA